LKWEASSGNFSPDGKSYTYTLNEDGVIDAYLVDRATNHGKKLGLPHGLNFFSGNPNEFSPQSDRVIVSHEASNQPGDLWIYNLVSQHADQLTFSEIASLRATRLPPSEIVHYKTFDGKIITALLWMPFNLKRDGSNPALVLPHGGPTGQMVDYWNTDVAALTSRGYICIAPNPRGFDGLWPGVSKSQLSGFRRWRSERRNRRRGISQGYGLRRPQENRHHRWVLRRLYDADGHRQSAGYLESRGRSVRNYQLVEHAEEFGSVPE
jgi:hypothetical protein